MKNTIKYIAHFSVETQTPLGIGSGRSGLLNDRIIARDANGLPYIPGSSLAGVVRHELEDNGTFEANLLGKIFGFQGEMDGLGSRLVFSHGQLTYRDGITAVEGLQNINFDDDYFNIFRQTPERDHVRITHRGTAAKHGKFEEELVPKGARFVFELELEGTKEDAPVWDSILSVLNSPQFRLGGGTRKGFGHFQVLACHTMAFDITQKSELLTYLGLSASLNKNISKWIQHQALERPAAHWKHYEVKLKSESFFLFGSGVMSNKADETPKRESFIEWTTGGQPTLTTAYLIPATSVKGALSHRVAYHYNIAKGNNIESIAQTHNAPVFDGEVVLAKHADRFLPFTDIKASADADIWKNLQHSIEALTIDDFDEWVVFSEANNSVGRENAEISSQNGENNEAVQLLFGSAKNDNEGSRGLILFSDVYLNRTAVQSKYFNHVAIDRFTGGSRDGALFTQEVTISDSEIILDIYVHKKVLENTDVKAAWEAALNDLTTGSLPLGGATNKGHGAFTGTYSIL